MIPLIGVKLPKGNAILLTVTIGGATTNLQNPKQTDVYTDSFPEGITIDHPLHEFYDMWMSSLLTDLEAYEEEVHVH
jgi:hypothetical protein